MLIWSIFLTGIIALFFFLMYPRTDYIQTVETPIAQTAIVQFTTQHKNALNLALKAVETAANRTDTAYTGSGTRNNTLTIPYPDFAGLEKTNYLPEGLEQLDWDIKPESRIVCVNYDAGATANLSTAGTCAIGGYNSTAQTTPTSGTRDYLITYAPKPAHLDYNFPGWGSSWADETKDMDTCGIVKNGKIQSPKCAGGLCDLSTSDNTTRLQNLIEASGLKLENDGFICISPIDHYAYDGVSITGKNPNMLAYYDGINNTWTGHSNSTTTWYDLSGNGNHGYFYHLTQAGNTGSATALSSASGWENNGYHFSGELDFVSLPESFNPSVNDLKEQGVEIVAEIVEPEDIDGRTFFVGLGNHYIAQSTRNTGQYRFNTMIRNEAASNAWAYSRFLSSAEENAGKFSLSTIWKTNHKLMAQDLYLYGQKANNAVHADKFQFKKFDRSTIGAKMRNAIGISYAGAAPSYPKRVYVVRLYNTRLTPAQIALNYQLDRKRFNIPKVVDDNGKDYTYLESSGNEYIDSDLVPTQTLSFDCTFQNDNINNAVPGYGNVFGSRYASRSREYQLTLFSGGSIAVGTRTSNLGFNTKDIHTVSFNGASTVNIDGTDKTITTSSLAANPWHIFLFAISEKGEVTQKQKGKIYHCSFGDDRDFIPAEDPFGRPSLYDKVTGKFFYNKGTGKFTLGTD